MRRHPTKYYIVTTREFIKSRAISAAYAALEQLTKDEISYSEGFEEELISFIARRIKIRADEVHNEV